MWCLPIILSLLITIIAIRHFREVYASECVGEAVVAVGSIRCTRLSFEQSLSTTCSGDVYRNGVLLNKTGQVFIINSLADYGVYGCCSKADGILNYFVFPRDCDGKCILSYLVRSHDLMVASLINSVPQHGALDLHVSYVCMHACMIVKVAI